MPMTSVHSGLIKQRKIKKNRLGLGNLMCYYYYVTLILKFNTGLSNIRLAGQERPARVFNPGG